MQQSRQHIDIILDSIADGVFTISPDKTITSFNRAAEKITGIHKDQAVGQKCFDVFHASICQGACAMENTIKTGRSVIDLPVNILNSKGETVPISVSTAVLKNRAGKIIGGVETFRDLSAIEQMRKELFNLYSFDDIISKNHEIIKIFNLLPDIAKSNSSVLIQGPSGSGKELFAKALHNHSDRSKAPYVVVNCGALPDTLLESEMFGYIRGAFTDAKTDKPGRFARAKGGTLFLDEVGELPPSLQVKLLRVLQDGEYEPLGSSKPRKADARIIAATNRELTRLMSEGKFREDLYYRLNVIKITLPPLSERREDIPLLVDHFVNRFNARMDRKIAGVSKDVMNFLMKYPFPGNIRELENIIEHAFVVCRRAVITLEHLPEELQNRTVVAAKDTPGGRPAPLIEKAQATVIRETLELNRGNKTKTARQLNMHPTTLWRKMKKLGI